MTAPARTAAATGAAPDAARPGPRPAGLPSEADIMGRAAGENFPVATRLLPGPARRHLLAFYGYARLVDQLGDAYDGDRLAALDWLEATVRAQLGEGGTLGHPLVDRAVRSVIETGADPAALFDLIEANRRDQTVRRYATFDDLVDYCRYSANPVGRLVLAAFDASTTDRQGWSDVICTGLQVIEHCQDVAEDAAVGRIYLPQADLDHFGVGEDELLPGAPGTTQLRALMAFQVARARRLLDEGGPPLVGSLQGRFRWAVAGFVAGGHAALDAIAARAFDPVGPGSARPSGRRLAVQLVRALRAAPALAGGLPA
jgi:squalene synthase HpnC